MKLPLALLALVTTLCAQQTPSGWRHEFGGYYKALFTASRTVISRDRYGDLLNRLRLSYDASYHEWFQAHVGYDNEFHFGNLIQQPEFGLVRRRQDANWLDLQSIVADREHAYWDTSLYRGYVTVGRKGLSLTVGRQRIAWGTARFWSPADAFNPLNPLQIETQERQGVDGAYLAYEMPSGLTWSTAYLPQNTFHRSTLATRLSGNVAGYDLAAFAGRFERDWMGGGSFAGQWGGAGIRGEATYRWRDPASPENNAFRLAAGADYAFANTLYLVGEYFYNQGQPVAGPGFDPASLFLFTSEIFTRNRHFLSAGATYDITPLFRVEGYVIADLAGPSALWMPQARYNLTPNTDLTFGAQLFTSRPGGEFEPPSNLMFAQFWLHF